MRPQFKGMLSVGTFPDSNTLVVFAPESLTSGIAETVHGHGLDQSEAGTESGVEVRRSLPAPFVANRPRAGLEHAQASSNSISVDFQPTAGYQEETTARRSK